VANLDDQIKKDKEKERPLSPFAMKLTEFLTENDYRDVMLRKGFIPKPRFLSLPHESKTLDAVALKLRLLVN
jgi:hypothetical protein